MFSIYKDRIEDDLLFHKSARVDKKRSAVTIMSGAFVNEVFSYITELVTHTVIHATI